IPGYTVLLPNLPKWKKQMLERRNCEVIDNYVRQLATEHEEKNRYSGVPSWKVDLLKKKQNYASRGSSARHMSSIENLEEIEMNHNPYLLSSSLCGRASGEEMMYANRIPNYESKTVHRTVSEKNDPHFVYNRIRNSKNSLQGDIT
ncbi:hypothetical protein Ciccas_014604, partial [Cichlidogyrus casuarinus]